VQALILAGGEGTRLRPLTSTVPKPVIPLVDRPMIAFMLEWLRGHGVDDVIVSCGYLAAGVRNVLGDGQGFGLRLRYVEEPEPLGTAGAVKLAEPLLDERFLVLNGDVLSDFDLGAELAQHEATGARATLALIAVEDPSSYGLVRLDGRREVTAFLEKPSSDQIDTDLINAGAYVLERDVLDGVPPLGPVSIERDVFPRLIGRGLFGHPVRGYWLDIGTPERYLQATFDILDGEVATAVGERLAPHYLSVAEGVAPEARVVPPALVEPGCRIAAGAHIGPQVVLGRDVEVGAGSHVERAVVLPGAEIGAGCQLRGCVVGAGAVLGERVTLEDGVVLGEGVTLGAGNHLAAGARLSPGVSLPEGAIGF
jgi:mannose-1-phosphate guanylyltransferase